MRIHFHFTFLPLALFAVMTLLGATTAPSLQTRLSTVLDLRDVQLKSDSSAVTDHGVQLYLQIFGLPRNQLPHGYGEWEIETARDDHGKDLRPRKHTDESGDNADGGDFNGQSDANPYVSIDSKDLADSKTDVLGFFDFQYKLQLREALRSSLELNELKGRFTVFAGGESHTARFEHALKSRGSILQDAAMKASGISVQLLKTDWEPREGESKSTEPNDVDVRAEGTRSLDGDTAIDFLDDHGNSVLVGHDDFALTGASEPAISYHLSRPLDDSMTVTIRSNLNQQKYVVPFDLHDIALP